MNYQKENKSPKYLLPTSNTLVTKSNFDVK